MLKINVDKKCFAKIVSGEQKEVYRVATPYNEKELTDLWGTDRATWKNPQSVCFETGEGESAKSCVARCSLASGEGYPEWGAEKGIIYMIVRIEKVEETEEPVEEVTVEEAVKVVEECTEALEESAKVVEEATEVLEDAAKVIEETSELVEEVKAEEEEIAPVKETVPLEDSKVLVKEETVDGCPVGLVVPSDVEEEPSCEEDACEVEPVKTVEEIKEELVKETEEIIEEMKETVANLKELETKPIVEEPVVEKSEAQKEAEDFRKKALEKEASDSTPIDVVKKEIK